MYRNENKKKKQQQEKKDKNVDTEKTENNAKHKIRTTSRISDDGKHYNQRRFQLKRLAVVT